jgi:hypothetical protein
MARFPLSVSQSEAGGMKSLPSRFARIFIVILPSVSGCVHWLADSRCAWTFIHQKAFGKRPVVI